MKYLFFDERIKPAERLKRVIITGVLVDQGRFKTSIRSATFQGRRSRRLAEITRVLEASAGFGLLGYALLSSSEYQPGVRDSSRDIPEMSRIANVWSHLAGQTAFALLGLALKGGDHFRTVDVYHDHYELTEEHRDAWNGAMRKSLAKFANMIVELTGLNYGDRIKIRRVEGISKRPTEAPEQTNNQEICRKGTWIAHELGTFSAALLTNHDGFTRIFTKDLTGGIKAVLSQHFQQ